MIELFLLTHRWDLNKYYQSGSVDLRMRVINKYFTFAKPLGRELHHQMQSRIMHMEHGELFGILPLCSDAVAYQAYGTS